MSDNYDIVSLILIAVSLLLVMAIALVAFFFFSRKKVISAELENANMEISHQREMLQATIITQENERKRIAQDLHDAISSKLNIVALNTNVLLEGEVKPEEANELLATILQISNTTLESSRQIAHDLLPPVLQKFGLRAAAEELANDFNRSTPHLVNFKGNYQQDSLSSKEELHVFRIIQELVNNSIKHGKATRTAVELNSGPFLLNYSDNGVGFDNTANKGKPGLGLKNIESRVELLGGQSKFESTPDAGITFKLTKLPHNV